MSHEQSSPYDGKSKIAFKKGDGPFIVCIAQCETSFPYNGFKNWTNKMFSLAIEIISWAILG